MKRPKLSARNALALAALGVTLVASVVNGREKPAPDIVAPVRSAARLAALAPAGELDLRGLQRPKKEARAVDLFAADAPSADVRASGHRAAPAEPALPFRYLGQVLDDGKLSVFLNDGSANYSVQLGQTVAKDYRVDRITEAAITFTYLPTGHRKVLAIPRVN